MFHIAHTAQPYVRSNTPYSAYVPRMPLTYLPFEAPFPILLLKIGRESSRAPHPGQGHENGLEESVITEYGVIQW